MHGTLPAIKSAMLESRAIYCEALEDGVEYFCDLRPPDYVPDRNLGNRGAATLIGPSVIAFRTPSLELGMNGFSQ